MCQAPFWKLERAEQLYSLGREGGWVGKPQDEVKWMMVENEERKEQEVDLTLNWFGISLFRPPPKSPNL